MHLLPVGTSVPDGYLFVVFLLVAGNAFLLSVATWGLF